MVFRAATHDQGSLAGRPPAGRSRRFYLAEDKGKLYYDDGAAWHEVGVEPIILSVGGEVEIDSQQREPFVVALDSEYAIACDGVSPFPRYYLLQRSGDSLTLVHAYGGDLSLYNEGYNTSAGFFGITRIDSTRAFVAFGGRNSSTSDVKYIGKVLTHDGSTITAGTHAAWFEALGTGGIISGGYATAMSTPAGDVNTGAVVYWNSNTGSVQGRKVTFTDTTVGYGTDTQIDSVGRDVQWARPFNNAGDLCIIWDDAGLYAVHVDIDVFTPTVAQVGTTDPLSPQCDHLAPGKVAVGWVDNAFTDRYAVEVDWDGSLVVGDISGLGASSPNRASPTKRWGPDAFHGWSAYNSNDTSPNGYNGHDFWVHAGAVEGERFLQFASDDGYDFAALDDLSGVVVFENTDAFGNLGNNTMAAILSRSST